MIIVSTQNRDKINVYKTTASFSHTLGNITTIIERYIRSQMPAEYFKGGYVTTEAGFRSIKHLADNKLSTYERPFLTLDPKFISDTETDALPWVNWDKFIPTDHINNPQEYIPNSEIFLTHETPFFKLGYVYKKYRFVIGITIIVDTAMQQMSLINYLHSNFRFRHPYTINRYFESMIPLSHIQYIADTLNLDIKSDELMTELNRSTNGDMCIVKLFRPATGTINFFTLRNADMQIRLPSYPADDTVKSGRITKYSQAQFSMEVEVNAISNFLLLTPDIVDTEDSEISSKYTIRFAIDGQAPDIANRIDKFTLVTKIAVQFDTTEEHIDLTQFLNNQQEDVFKYVRDILHYVDANGIDIQFCMIKVYHYKDELDFTNPDIGSMDYKTLELSLKNVEISDLYTIAIYYDLDYARNILGYVVK